ncbi:(2Fe-2S) ferredoxin domain-containing protein [Acidaminobacter sp. JC074]|uniref:(2Fe-2S) ferredoxin domain-containing protein n=1 Tax=Acidaminobacter sp. JC074 TaxID=2530199 RepID=UPI001F116C08|nr:(2Fe-2S) ferredoxin domain-containing protein [Acidaminobacter sp. JC074]MCH4890892.1 (2Fe-2S) ferredoxin domain-containing protein [Acidaminobacter sp. JC074]
MKIKSLDELIKLREDSIKKVNLRETGEDAGDTIELMVGMATCGIAAGARETLQALMEIIQEKGLTNVKLVQVGCLGFCHSEPTVQVNVPDQEPTLYGNVDKDVAKRIIEEHVMNGKMVDNHILIKSFDKA